MATKKDDGTKKLRDTKNDASVEGLMKMFPPKGSKKTKQTSGKKSK